MRIQRLDGLRAIAVVAVALHHHELLSGGWVGVELFFVLSGFMITRVLRRDRKDPMYWKRFYIRRATRILPPVLLLIALVAVHYRPPVRSLLMYLFFMGNFSDLTRWGISPQLGLLWSLAVEEHFYLLFPFAVWYLERKKLMVFLALVIVLEPIARLVGTSYVHSYISIYAWTFFSMDGLAMGAMLALLTEDARATALLTRWSGVCALVFAGIFAGLWFAQPAHFNREANTHLFNSAGYSLVAVTSLFVIAYLLLHSDVAPSRLLALRPLVFIGTISYGLYLCHITVMLIVMKTTGLPMRHVFPLSFSVAVLCSWLSFRFYEKPLMAWGHRISASASPPAGQHLPEATTTA
jgi:peptidoglycan/LPS O-acetylase OafA/YrhL